MYPEQHQYLTVIGDSYSAAERWQFGLRLSDGGVSNQVTAEAISDDVEAWWRGAAPYIAGTDQFLSTNTHRLTECKVARIQQDGTYPDNDPSYSHFFLPPIVGQVVHSDFQIAQESVAVTLTTALPRGYASKGRIYLPPSYHYAPAADGLLTVADATALANSVRKLINAINANTVVGNVMIYSKGKGVPSYNQARNRIEYTWPNAGASQVVTGVRVGRVVDTQRRRRRSLAELPQVVAL
jgi:hypothetical protein